MLKIGLENNAERRSQAWVLGHPGCFAYGANGDAALNAIPKAIQAYGKWISSHTTDSWFPEVAPTQSEYHLEETWECYSINEDYELVKDGYEVNAWFRHDWLPLNEIDIQHSLLLLGWGRQELLKTVSGLDEEILNRTYPHERWSIAGILKHVAGAEWWYMDRLSLAFAREEVPDDPFDRLEKVRSYLIETLTGLAGSKRVVGIEGEFWSPSKLLRRAVWHECDHIDHIRKLL
jgi:hypothetical protein